MRKKIAALLMSAVLAVMSAEGVSAEEKSELTECTALAEISAGTLLRSGNGDKSVAIGTMNKLMTVLLTAEAIERGELAEGDTVKASTAANSMQGAQIWLMPGEEMSVEDLLKGVIIGNANDASVALAEAVCGSEEKFVKAMNSRADELGMKNTSFTNCCGYYDSNRQLSSANDMTLLAAELYKHEPLRKYFTCRMDYLRGGGTELVTSNKLVERYKGLIGFKAGYTEQSGYCVAAGAERDGEAYVAVILGCDDEDEMFSRVKEMLNGGFNGFCVVTPPLPEKLPEKIAVKKSFVKEIAVNYDMPEKIVIPEGTASAVKGTVIVPDNVFAPVEIGEKIGEIHFYRGDEFLFSSDIKAAECAEKITVLKAFVIMLKFLLQF